MHYLHSKCPNVYILDGKIPLPGNSLSLTYFGRACSLRVERVTGVDGLSLERPPPSPGLEPDPEDTSLMSSALPSTSMDLSLQLSFLTMEEQAGDPGEPGPAASTPCRPFCVPCVPPTPPCNPQTPTEPKEGSLSLEMEDRSALSPEQINTDKQFTTPPGGALSTDTFYCLSFSTKVKFRDRYKETQEEQMEDTVAQRSKVTFSMIGGLSSQLNVIRETIELPLKHPELFSNYGTQICYSFQGGTLYRVELENS